jgi:mannitol 2-dehydrogenase
MAYPAALLGYRDVHEVMADPLIRGFLEKLETQEIIPCLAPPEGVDLMSYLQVVLQRFSNSAVRDTVARLASDGSNRQPKFILPSTRDRLLAGRDIAGLALVSASWCRYCDGTDDDGAPIVLEDPAAPRLREAAHRAQHDPVAFLGLDDIFGDLAQAPVFRQAFATALRSLWGEGTRTTLRRYLEGRL